MLEEGGTEWKVAGSVELESVFSEPLSLARRILSQSRHGKDKLYSIHAPEVECIAKGKAHKKYEVWLQGECRRYVKRVFYNGHESVSW